jgi:preprotein translocase subunit SecA
MNNLLNALYGNLLRDLNGIDKTIYHTPKYSKVPYLTSVRSQDDPTINRNSSCPCGSGKKFKNCCLKLKEDE